jgi:branched-chain amino acid transport system substrate-binding protein
MTRRNLFVVIVIVVIVAAVGAFLASQTSTSGPVKVLVVMSPSDTGADMTHAVELALQQANGMAGSHKVELITAATDAPEEVLALIDQYKNDPSVVAMIGATSSGLARQIIPPLDTLSMALITPAATWPGLTKPGFGPGEPGIYYPTGRRNFFRVLPSDDIQGKVAVSWLEDEKLTNIYVTFNPTSLYASGLAGIVAANAEEAQMTIVASDPFDPVAATPEEVDALADKIIASNADAVFYPYSGPQSWDLALALRARKPDLVIIGGDGLLGDDLPEDNASLNGVYATSGVEPTQIDAAAAFVDAFQTTYTKAPQFYVLTAYEAMQVLLKAISTADAPTREGVLNAMGKVGEFNGAMGTWTFDANGDTSLSTFSLVQLEDGEWKVVHVFR